MNPLISILRAAHCRSTHHFFAIDALPMVQTEPGKRLVRVLLRHHDRYLVGAKDPDTRFRDFQNHVVHVTDGYWGGAPRVAHAWYDRMQRYLRSDRYADAAHAAGVLSHYFTDPMMPLHTQQSEVEKILHRPIEWSITKSYESIFRTWQEDKMRIVFNLSDSTGWLGEAILHGARFANRSYFPLLETYDLDRGRVDPPAGLGLVARQSLAELFGLAITGWARVLERAARDCEDAMGRPIAPASLCAGAVLATIRVPAKVWLRRIANQREQEAISDLVSEFIRTGTLKEHLPAEVDIVHRVVAVHKQEKVWQTLHRQRQLASKETVVAVENGMSTADLSTQPDQTSQLDQTSPPDQLDSMPATIPFVPRSTRAMFRLTGEQQLIDAPSIGPKTAARFAAIGIDTVGQFLDQPAAKLSEALKTYWINTETVTQWQWQSKLMCEIPNLLARDTQMLAGASYDAAASVAACDAETLHAEISRFAVTSAGRRYLRGVDGPKLADVDRWIADARSVAIPAEVSPAAAQRRAA